MKQVSEGLKKKKKNVMVAIDESESSHYALLWVLNNLKKSIDSTKLVLVAAQPLPTDSYPISPSLGFARLYFSATQPVNMFGHVQEKNRKVSLGILKKAKSICDARGVDAETFLEFGDPKDAICEAVSKHNISLLVVGNHEVGIFKRLLEGSISDHCLKNAKCPVLVVKKDFNSCCK